MIVQLVVAAGNRAGQIIPVSTEKFIIGRAIDCHLKSRSELISRYHCAILVGDGVVVRDLGSRNGVRLNGEKISTEQNLKNGDKLEIGPLEFYAHVIADDNTSAGVSEAGMNWQDQSLGHEVFSNATAATVLLDHLKSLNKEIKSESEQPVANFLKKFL